MSNRRSTSVHVGGAWRLVLRDLGIDEVMVLRRAGLPENAFDGDGTHVSVNAFYALHDAVEAESNNPELALHAGRVVSIELFDPALFAAICSPDMNTAASRLGQFKQLVGAFSLDVDVAEDETRLRYRCKSRPDVQRTRGLAELVFLVALARRATRHEIKPLRVTAQRLPTDPTAYEAYFGCPLQQAKEFTVVHGTPSAPS